MVWRFHGEADASGGVFGGNSSSSIAVNANHGGGPPPSLVVGHSVAGENADFNMMDDFVHDIADGGVTVMRMVSRPCWSPRMWSFLRN